MDVFLEVVENRNVVELPVRHHHEAADLHVVALSLRHVLERRRLIRSRTPHPPIGSAAIWVLRAVRPTKRHI